MRRRSRPVSVRNAVPRVLEELGFGEVNAGLRVAACWDEVVGPEVARHCRPTRLRNRVLEVCVDSSVWSQEMQFRRPAILEGLRERLGAEAPGELRCHVG